MDHIPLLAGGFLLLFVIRFWLMRGWELVQTYRRDPRIDPGNDVELPDAPPLISVIVPAHNEEASIGECLKSVLNQDYPRFELICIDDRSEDRTLCVAESVCEGYREARVVSVYDLPEGWTGKCRALDAGVKVASGEWLAFLDADSSLHESTLTHCYHAASARGVSMITLSPKFVLKTFWEKALQPTFAAMSCILFPLGKINDPTCDTASANGMFYMISRHAYEKIGGHHDVKDLAVEDIGIGKRVKASGLGLVFANGRKVLRTRMYTNFKEIVNGWTRILSASMNYEMATVLRYLLVHLLMSVPVLALALCLYIPEARELWPDSWFALPVMCGACMIVVPYFYFGQLGVSTKYSVLLAIGNLMIIWVFAVIVKKILCNDALQWRGTTYDASRYKPKRLDPPASQVYGPPVPSAVEEVH
ncbi:MAG: glycosyltransferase family 2 protein [Desulfomonilaceae bacterium]|nr:glycosyltransferase family 2 protein [Desulfomonilaceae bacterium]